MFIYDQVIMYIPNEKHSSLIMYDFASYMWYICIFVTFYVKYKYFCHLLFYTSFTKGNMRKITTRVYFHTALYNKIVHAAQKWLKTDTFHIAKFVVTVAPEVVIMPTYVPTLTAKLALWKLLVFSDGMGWNRYLRQG